MPSEAGSCTYFRGFEYNQVFIHCLLEAHKETLFVTSIWKCVSEVPTQESVSHFQSDFCSWVMGNPRNIFYIIYLLIFDCVLFMEFPLLVLDFSELVL